MLRERLRLEAADAFARGEDNVVIAHRLRVSVRSVQRWRHDWQSGGPKALRSKGPASLPLLSEFQVLEHELAKGPAEHGWPDQKWTLARIKTLIGRRFHISYAAHRQLGGPIVVVWDNLNTHLTDDMRRFVASHNWLTIYQLPSYAPDLNPVEGIWSLLRHSKLVNRIITDPDHLMRIARSDLHHIGYHPNLIGGCLAATGLPPTPKRS